MPEKDPQLFTVASYAWVTALSGWGGTVRYLRELEAKNASFRILEFASEIVTSGFVGVVTFVLCKAGGLDQYVTAALVAVAGHEGGRALQTVRAVIMRRAGVKDLDGERRP